MNTVTHDIVAKLWNLCNVEEQEEIVRRIETLFTYADRLGARYIATRAARQGFPRRAARLTSLDTRPEKTGATRDKRF